MRDPAAASLPLEVSEVTQLFGSTCSRSSRSSTLLGSTPAFPQGDQQANVAHGRGCFAYPRAHAQATAGGQGGRGLPRRAAGDAL